MSILKNEEKDSIKSTLVNYLLHCNQEVDTDVLVNKINGFVPNEERYYQRGKNTENEINILLTTGAGNLIQGGADIWTNYFIEHIWKSLPKRKNWKLIIDSKKPTDFNPQSLPEDLDWHFHYDDPELTEELLSECEGIYCLHNHYHRREHIWKWESKFRLLFVHAYPPEMEEVIKKIPELKRLQFNTKVDSAFYKEFLQSFKKRIWIGNNPTKMMEEFPNYTYNVPNFYKFERNKPLDNESIDNGLVGFASRGESRKCMHWLHGHKGFILSSKYDFENLKSSTGYQFPGVRFYQWDAKIHDTFMNKKFGIFHGAYFKEPFGYSIFQAVDYGKLPIIHKDWAKEVDYKYRASTKNEFDKMIRLILLDTPEERYKQFANLKTYMLRYGDIEKWKKKIFEFIK